MSRGWNITSSQFQLTIGCRKLYRMMDLCKLTIRSYMRVLMPINWLPIFSQCILNELSIILGPLTRKLEIGNRINRHLSNLLLAGCYSLCETTNDGHIKKWIQMTWDTQGFFSYQAGQVQVQHPLRNCHLKDYQWLNDFEVYSNQSMDGYTQSIH